jgi:hypothetical protein
LGVPRKDLHLIVCCLDGEPGDLLAERLGGHVSAEPHVLPRRYPPPARRSCPAWPHSEAVGGSCGCTPLA